MAPLDLPPGALVVMRNARLIAGFCLHMTAAILHDVAAAVAPEIGRIYD